VEKFGNLPTIVDISNHFIDRPYFFPCHCIYANGKQPYNVPFSMIESIRHNPSCYAFFDGKVAEHFFALCDALSANYGTDKLSFTASLSELTVFISDFCFSPEKKESLDNFVPSSFDNAPDALKELLEIVPKFAPNPLYNSDMLKTIQYIHQNYMEAISISKLASMLNVSSNYYAILFRKLTNTNFTDFLTGIRLYHARQMLCETSFPISQIADRCGFSDAAYFAKFFKQNYGMTPRQYRALKKGESQ